MATLAELQKKQTDLQTEIDALLFGSGSNFIELSQQTSDPAVAAEFQRVSADLSARYLRLAQVQNLLGKHTELASDEPLKKIHLQDAGFCNRFSDTFGELSRSSPTATAAMVARDMALFRNINEQIRTFHEVGDGMDAAQRQSGIDRIRGWTDMLQADLEMAVFGQNESAGGEAFNRLTDLKRRVEKIATRLGVQPRPQDEVMAAEAADDLSPRGSGLSQSRPGQLTFTESACRRTGIDELDNLPVSNQYADQGNPQSQFSGIKQYTGQFSLYQPSDDSSIFTLSPLDPNAYCQTLRIPIHPDSPFIREADDNLRSGGKSIISLSLVKMVGHDGKVGLYIYSAGPSPSVKTSTIETYVYRDANAQRARQLTKAEIKEANKYTNGARADLVKGHAAVAAGQIMATNLALNADGTRALLCESQADAFKMFRRIALGGHLSKAFKATLQSPTLSPPVPAIANASPADLNKAIGTYLCLEKTGFLDSPTAPAMEELAAYYNNPLIRGIHQATKNIFEAQTNGRTFRDIIQGQEIQVAGQSRRVGFDMFQEEDNQKYPNAKEVYTAIESDPTRLARHLADYACLRAVSSFQPDEYRDLSSGENLVTTVLDRLAADGEIFKPARFGDNKWPGMGKAVRAAESSETIQECLLYELNCAARNMQGSQTLLPEDCAKDAVDERLSQLRPDLQQLRPEDRIAARQDFLKGTILPENSRVFRARMDEVRDTHGQPLFGKSFTTDWKVAVGLLELLFGTLYQSWEKAHQIMDAGYGFV